MTVNYRENITMEPEYIIANVSHIPPTDFPFPSCFYLEFPDGGIDCSQYNPGICVRCEKVGRFMTGGKIDEIGSPGHIVAIVEWIFIALIGSFGTFTNSLILIILKRKERKRSFDLLLMGLAFFDLISSVTAVIAASASISIFEKLDRGLATHYFAFIGVFTCFFARSGSSFTTVLITAERYLVIAFPFRSKTWFTPKRTKIWITCVLSLAALIALPRFSSFAVSPNNFPRDIHFISELDYVIQATPLERFWYGTMKAFLSAIDFWVPLPLLLLFNILAFIEIRKYTHNRKSVNMMQAKEIRATKMFVPVVIVLFLCNVGPFVYFYYLSVEGVVYRELFIGVLLSVAVNSAVNLPIYYFKGGSFQREVKKLFPATWKIRCGRGGNDQERESGTTEINNEASRSGLPVLDNIELTNSKLIME